MLHDNLRLVVRIVSLAIVLVCEVWTDQALGSEQPQTLYLATREAERDKGPLPSQLLLRELVRQSILIAGRDQLGLATRDMSLREDVPSSANGDKKPLQVLTNARHGRHLRLRLFAHGSPEAEATPLFDRQFEQPHLPEKVIDHLFYVEELERLSRGELVEILRQQGFDGKAIAWQPDVEVAAQIQVWLLEMNFFSQFAALRPVAPTGACPRPVAANLERHLCGHTRIWRD